VKAENNSFKNFSFRCILLSLPCNMNISQEEFRQDTYSVIAAIPRGKVITYGQIAGLIGWPRHSRLVGHVLHSVSENLHLPCHRVVNSQGQLAIHWPEQHTLLAAEGVSFLSNGHVNLKKCQWDFMRLMQDVE